MGGLDFSLLVVPSSIYKLLRSMYQNNLDSYSGGNIDISHLTSGGIGSTTPTVSFGNNAELNRYKAQQLQMQNTQYGNQIGVMRTVAPHQDALSGAASAQVLQSQMEILEVQTDVTTIQAATGSQINAQYLQHLETQRSQLGVGAMTHNDQLLMTNTFGDLAVPHQAAYIDTNLTTYSMMDQQRADQMAALNQARQQQLAMLTETHMATGRTTSNGYIPGSSDPKASFLGSNYPSNSLSTYSAIQMTITAPTSTSTLGSKSPSISTSSLSPSSSFALAHTEAGSPLPLTSTNSSFISPSTSSSTITGAALTSPLLTTTSPSSYLSPSIDELSAGSTIASYESGAGVSSTFQDHKYAVSTKPDPEPYNEGYAS